MNIVARDKKEEENDIDLSFPGCHVWLPLVLEHSCYCSNYLQLLGRGIYEAKYSSESSNEKARLLFLSVWNDNLYLWLRKETIVNMD